MNEITVITACYNGYKYMENYFHSLENQTFKDFEVIIVDDCSTDDTYKNLLDYKSKSKLNIKIIHNETNQKPSFSRQIGVREVTTEWLSFCDCDDWYEIDFIEKMIKKAEEQKADIVMCHFNYCYSDGTKKFLPGLNILNEQSSKEEFLAYTPMSLCRSIYKKDLFNNLNIPHINNAEDGAVIPQLLVKSNKTTIIHEGLYNYYIRNDSLSSTPSPGVYRDFIKAQNVIDAEIGDLYPKECEFIGIKNVCYGATLNALKANVPLREIREFYNQFKLMHKNWHKNTYIRSLSTRKKVFLLFLRIRMYFPLRIFARIHQKMSTR